MKVRTAIRKSVKWGGAVAVVMLAATWIASGWWAVWLIAFQNYEIAVSNGALSWSRMDFGAMTGQVFGGPEATVPGESFVWWFKYVEGWGHLTNDYTFVVPLWFPLLITLIATGFAWRPELLARARAALGLCPGCGYDRRGLAAGVVCPECGVAAKAGVTS